jgi:hypothetical protein
LFVLSKIYSEVRRLLGILSNTGAIPVPEVLVPALAQARAALCTRLSLDVAPQDAQLCATPVSEASTLRAALLPVLQAATLPPVTGNIPALGAVLVHCILPPELGRTRLRTECLAFIGHLEEQIGILAVLIEERLLRGTPYSCIWAVPAEKFVYAQSISMNPSADGKNRSPWWPCMVIAAGDCSKVTHSASATMVSSAAEAAAAVDDDSSIVSAPQATAGVQVKMQPEVMRGNLARFPSDIVKQLNKLKPRTSPPAPAVAPAAAIAPLTAPIAPMLNAAGAVSAQSSAVAVPLPAPPATAVPEAPHHPAVQAGGLSVPDGYLLLEYFGAHDFGWVKADAVYSMYSYVTAADG